MNISENNWKTKLTPKQYHILREKGTEPPFSGKYLNFDKTGTFVCAACGNQLFESGTKFKSDCGWPSFYDARKGAVEFHTDTSHGMTRTEVTCAQCGGHLGHIFNDGPKPTGRRYCINSLALKFNEK
jgi:peptide-methionine (R)-S-oxide reductase